MALLVFWTVARPLIAREKCPHIAMSAANPGNPLRTKVWLKAGERVHAGLFGICVCFNVSYYEVTEVCHFFVTTRYACCED